jgi:uncharacterized beta-barrel protein YwiB (DUF1934 family)
VSLKTIPARVTVLGRIDTGDGRPDLIRNEYPARYAETAAGFTLEYDETESQAHVRLTFDDARALMERDGVPETRMEFVPGLTLDAVYILPEGVFDMQTSCDSLTLTRSTGRGTLRIAYRLMSAGQLISKNRLMVTYIC